MKKTKITPPLCHWYSPKDGLYRGSKEAAKRPASIVNLYEEICYII